MADKKAAVKKPVKIFQVIRDGVVFELQSEPEGGYTVSVPALPGCISYGRTFEEAMEMIKDAITGWLEVAKEVGVPIPEQFEAIRLARI
ncbi:MAG: type II toxin-antitoxin system HicB family antitoxin [Dehalococcoidales bacterium]|nr:type II toxin-antitoxin system HicB family antitoxin [Dehalococcoidales bacterium]